MFKLYIYTMTTTNIEHLPAQKGTRARDNNTVVVVVPGLFLFTEAKFSKVLCLFISQLEWIKKNLCKGRTLYKTFSHKEIIKSGSSDKPASTIDIQTLLSIKWFGGNPEHVDYSCSYLFLDWASPTLYGYRLGYD